MCADKTRRSAAQRRSAARRQRERQRQARCQTAAGASDCELIGMAWSNVLNRQHGDDCTLPPVTGSATAAACSATQDMQSPASHSTTISAVEAVEAVPARMGNNTSISCTGGTARNDTFDLRQGQILPGGNAVYAADGSAFLILQNIGRLVLYRGPNQLHNKGQIWASDEQAAQPLPPAARVVAAAARGTRKAEMNLSHCVLRSILFAKRNTRQGLSDKMRPVFVCMLSNALVVKGLGVHTRQNWARRNTLICQVSESYIL